MIDKTRRRRARATLAVFAVGALVAPAAASAVPSVFSETAKVVPAGQTPDATWDQSDLQDETRYVVSDNGFTEILRESNGDLDGGVLTYDVLPLSYRTAIADPVRFISEANRGAQPHAQCPVSSLTSNAAITGWQGSEPGYGYVPFQATSAGLGDDPAKWLPKVKAATGLTLTPSTDLAAACTSLGGTLVPADTVVTAPGPLATGLTAPLEARAKTAEDKLKASEAKVADLTTKLADSDKARKKAEDDAKAQKLEATPFVIKVPSSATLQRGLEVNVTGPPKRPVLVRIFITEKQRKKLKLKSVDLGIGTGATDEKGKALVIVQPNKKTAKVLLKLIDALPVTVAAISGDRAYNLALDLGA